MLIGRALPEPQSHQMFFVAMVSDHEDRVPNFFESMSRIKALRPIILAPYAQDDIVKPARARLTQRPCHECGPNPAACLVPAHVELFELHHAPTLAVMFKGDVKTDLAIADHQPIALCNAKQAGGICQFGLHRRQGIGLLKKHVQILGAVKMAECVHETGVTQFRERWGIIQCGRAIVDHGQASCTCAAGMSPRQHLSLSEEDPLMHRMLSKFSMIMALCCATIASPAAAKNEKTFATLSDIGAYGLATLAIGVPIVKGDTNGALQAGGSIAAAQLVTFGLKEAFPELRPDGSDRKSFPSGHSGMSFAAAATLFNRQGQSVGIPAFAVASFVAFARVQADKHHWYDVVAGAAIGTASGFLITRERAEKTALVVPWGDSKGAGMTLAMRF
jgi:hypothetical protein